MSQFVQALAEAFGQATPAEGADAYLAVVVWPNPTASGARGRSGWRRRAPGSRPTTRSGARSPCSPRARAGRHTAASGRSRPDKRPNENLDPLFGGAGGFARQTDGLS